MNKNIPSMISALESLQRNVKQDELVSSGMYIYFFVMILENATKLKLFFVQFPVGIIYNTFFISQYFYILNIILRCTIPDIIVLFQLPCLLTYHTWEY